MRTLTELSVPLTGNLDVLLSEQKKYMTINKEITVKTHGKYWHDENSKKIKLKIDIYEIGENLVSVCQNSVLTPDTYGPIYSISDLRKSSESKEYQAEELNQYELLEYLIKNPNDLVRIDRGIPNFGIIDGLSRLSLSLIKYKYNPDSVKKKIFENNVRNWHNKGLIGI